MTYSSFLFQNFQGKPPQGEVKKPIGIISLTLVFILLTLILVGCSSETESWSFENATWDEIVQRASGTQVNFHMWGGSQAINSWIDNTVAPELESLYNLKVNRVPSDASVFVSRLAGEKAQGRDTGTIDLMWINGENFKRAYQAEILTGPFVQLLPNFQNFVNPETAAFDFGFPTMGYEAPYGRAQFVFEFDPTKVQPPGSYRELSQWVQTHPGLFTYPEPSDFTGSAFIRQAFIALTGGAQQYLEGWNPELYERNAPVLWDFLNNLAPYLWQEGRSYPRDLPFLDSLFERAEVAINMTYTQAQTQARILEGRYPDHIRSFVLRDASLFNTHFTAIAFNAPNSAGALVLSNHLLSPQAQLSKNSPENWGDFTVLDLTSLSSEDRRAFENLDLGPATLDLQVLEAAAVPELPSEYLEALQRDWYIHVLGQ